MRQMNRDAAGDRLHSIVCDFEPVSGERKKITEWSQGAQCQVQTRKQEEWLQRGSKSKGENWTW